MRACRVGEAAHPGPPRRPPISSDECASEENPGPDALYGLRGVRVGEASHPGPRRRRLVRSSSVESSWCGPDRTLLDDFERDLLASGLERAAGTQIDASSDDEPLMRPSSGRHVVPRMSERDHGESLDNQVAPSAIDISPRGLHAGGSGHRRRLVVEVAPGVVDASAVALPSSHVIPDEESDCDASVPVFDPLDSDEEDELDALSRNATGATQVDRDDEPMVCDGRFTPWSHADSVAGTAIDSAQPTVSMCEASQTGGDRDASQHPRFTGNRFAALQCEDTEDPLRQSDVLVSPANSNVSHQGRVAVILESQRKRMRDRH